MASIGIPTVTQRTVLPDASPLPYSNTDIVGDSGLVVSRALQDAGAQIGRAIDPLVAAQKDIQRQKDETDFDKALLEYDTQAETLLNGPGGLSTKQGKAAIDYGSEVSKQLGAIKSSVLGNPAYSQAARRAITNSIMRRQLDYTGKVNSYVNEQYKVHMDAMSDVYKNEALDSAMANYRDPQKITEALTTVYVQYDMDAQRNGWDDAVTNSKKEEAATTLLTGVIDRYLANGDIGGAQRFYNSNKSDIDGRKRPEIERVLEQHRKAAVAEMADDVRDAVTILSMGKTPVGLDKLQSAVKGSKYASVLSDAVKDRDTLDTFAHKPLIDQQAELQQLTLKKEFTPEEARLYQGMANAHATIVKRLDAGDGLALARELDVIGEAQPLDFTKPDTLKARRRQADLASEHFGVNVSPLTAGEISSLSSQLETASADQVAALLGSLHDGFGDQANVIAGQLSKGKRPEYGPAMVLAADGKPDASQEATSIVLGGRQRRALGSDLELTAENKRPIISDVIGNMFEGIEGEPLDEFITAADSLYAARRANTGDLTFDADTYGQALKDAMGGVIEFNGRKVIPPTYSMDESEFRSFVRSLTDAEMTRYSVTGGIPFAGEQPFSASMFSRQGPLGVFGAEAQLVSVGPGIYRVSIPGLGFVQDGSNGLPYEIDLKEALKKKRGE